MVSLWFLDYSDWWTLVGNAMKYTLFALAVIAGVAIFARSKRMYFFAGWLAVIAAPLSIIALAEHTFGTREIFRAGGASQEQVFVYLWVGLILAELFLIWIPLFAIALKASLSTLPTETRGA